MKDWFRWLLVNLGGLELKNNKNGFTLLEVLVVLVLTGIFLLAASKLMYAVKKGEKLSTQFFEVIAYSENLLEYFKQSEIDYPEGSYSPEEIIEKKTFSYLTQGTAPNIVADNIVKIKKVGESPQKNEKLFSIQLKICWEGITGEKSFKIGTYKYQ